MLAIMHLGIRTTSFLCSLFLAATVCTAQGQVFGTDREQVRKDAVAARATWKRFETTFAHKDGDRFLVKKLFTEDKREELLWVTVDEIADGKITGKVGNRPAVLKHVKRSDAVTIDARKILDWLVVRNGQNYAGGYSLHDEEPVRSMRLDSDKAGLPFLLFDDFLVGLSLNTPSHGKDLAAFKKQSWNKVWIGLKRSGLNDKAVKTREALYSKNFDAIALPRNKLVILLHRKDKPTSQTVPLTSDDSKGFRKGELLFKIHAEARVFYRLEKSVVFRGLMFVTTDAKAVPTYLVNTNLQ